MAEVLIMAMTRMNSGICTAGYVNEPHPQSVLRWVRPVKEFGSLLLGDMTTADGRVVRIGDVVALSLRRPHPDGAHTEDWITDFIHRRPRVLRRLEGQKRADFLAKHIDRNPAQVLREHVRSLCLVHPGQLWADFSWDRYSGKYRARIGYRLSDPAQEGAAAPDGLIVTDLAWRALGRQWLGANDDSRLHLEQPELLRRLSADTIYLSVGLARPLRGEYWPLVVGVHPVPDYDIAIDYGNP